MKAYIDVEDVKQRYDIGKDAAYRIIREVKHFAGNTFGGAAKVLPSELTAWEESRGRNNEQ